MRAIIDLVLLGILIVCIWTGYKKGLLMGLGGILCIIISIYGANLAAMVLSYDMIPALKPFANGYTESLLAKNDSKVLKQMGWEHSEFSVDDLLAQNPERRQEFAENCYLAMGLDRTTAGRLAEQAVAYLETGGSMMEAVVHTLCATVSYVAAFTVAFLMILIILTVLGNLPNLSYKLPHLDLVNDIGGAVLGLVRGIMFCALLVWVLKFLGMLLGSETLGSSIFGGMLLRWDPLYPYLHI